jgi:uracil-DNA glycosylase
MDSRSVITFILCRALPRAGNGLSLSPLPVIDRVVKKLPFYRMGFQRQNFDVDAAASLLGWWRDAGVDCAISETAHDWLGAAKAAKPVIEASAEPVVPALPGSLEALVDLLRHGDVPDAGPAKRRVAANGNETSDLMVLVDFPDAADADSGELLSDAIFDKMLEALGRDRSVVYVAALCPGRPITGRLSDASIDALAVLARQHIAFVAPRQLWLMGSAASRAILGIDDAAAKGKLHKVNLQGITMNAIATAHPRMFEDSKSRKSAAWVEMQRLIIRNDA